MNIYVGNLHYDISVDELKSYFLEFGEVESAKIIIDKLSGKSKGFGFVEMPNQDEGQKAMDALDGKVINGRNLKVNLAQQKSKSNFRRERR